LTLEAVLQQVPAMAIGVKERFTEEEKMRTLLKQLIVSLFSVLLATTCLAQELIEVFPDTLNVAVRMADSPEDPDASIEVYFAAPTYKVVYTLQRNDVISGLQDNDVEGILQNAVDVAYASDGNIPSSGAFYRHLLFVKSVFPDTQSYVSLMVNFLQDFLGAAAGLEDDSPDSVLFDDARAGASCVPLVEDAVSSTSNLRSTDRKVPLSELLSDFRGVYAAGLCVRGDLRDYLNSIFYTPVDPGTLPDPVAEHLAEYISETVYFEQTPVDQLVNHLVENGLVFISIWEAIDNIIRYGEAQGLFDSIQDSVVFGLRTTLNSKAVDPAEAEEQDPEFDLEEVIERLLG
jgi:hypothetical protein